MSIYPIRIAALAGVLFFASFSAASQEKVIKIGALVPLTGGTAHDGDLLLKGHQLAIDEINQKGGIASLGNAKLALAVGDTQSKPETGKSEAERLIDREGVSALVGAFATAVTTPAAQAAERAEVPFIITSAVADNLTEKGQRYVFRVSPKSKWAATQVGNFIADMKAQGKGITKAALFYEDGPYGQSLATNYRLMLAERGIPLVADESVRSGSPDVTTQVAKMRAAQADIVLVGTYVNDAVVLFRAMSSQNYKPAVLGFGSSFVHPSLLQAGPIVENALGLTEWVPDLKKDAVTHFVQAYEAKYKDRPNSASAQAYASIWVLAEAIGSAKSAKPADIRNALATLKIVSGPATVLPGGPLSFDAQGQYAAGQVGVQVIGGKFVTVWPKDIAVRPVAGLMAGNK